MDESQENQSEDDVIWPPPPNIPEPSSQKALRRVFSFVRRSWRVTGSVSDFVAGAMAFGDDGIQVSGTKRVRQEIQIPVLLMCAIAFFQLPVIVIIIAVFLEAGSRRKVSLFLPWEDIEAIAIEEGKLLVGLIYHEPDNRGKAKTYSLAFPVDVKTYEDFHDAAVAHAPERIFSVSFKPVLAVSTLFTAASFLVYIGWVLSGKPGGWL